jgi:hypothetical protein
VFPGPAFYLAIMIPGIAVLLTGGLFARCRTAEQREKLLVLAAILCGRRLSVSSDSWYVEVSPSPPLRGLLPCHRDTGGSVLSPGSGDPPRAGAMVKGWAS